MRLRLILAVLVALALIGGCGGGSGGGPPLAPSAPPTASPAPTAAPTAAPALPPGATGWRSLGGTITIDGSSTVFPITELAAFEFGRLAPDVRLQLGVSGTGGGFKKFCAGEVPVANASRPISAEERAACEAAGYAFVELPIAFDGLSVVVHPSNTWATCLTLAELARIWGPAAQGRVTRWSDVRPDWPAEPLALYGAGRDSGTFDYFTSAVVGEEGAARSDVTASEDDYVLAQDIAADPGGLGFFGYAYYREYQDRLGLVAVDSGAGCVAPSPATIADGSYRPLSRPIFIYVRLDALARPEIAAFVDYYLANAARLVGQARYIPLPERAYGLVSRRAADRVAGTVFADGLRVGVSVEELLSLEEGTP